MLQKILSKSTGLGGKILVGLICFVLAAFGFGAFNLFAVSEPAAASVNGEDITVRQLSAAIDREKNRIESQYGDGLSDAVLNSLINESILLEQLVNRELLEQNAEKLRLVNSRREFLRQIESDAMFQEDGKFSIEKYRRVLGSVGYSVQSYEQLAGLDNMVQQLIDANTNTSFLTPTEKRQSASLQEQVRDIAYMEFHKDDFKDDIAIHGDDMEAYYELHQDDFISEESYTFHTVTLSIDPFLAEVQVSEDDIQAFYDTTVESEKDGAKRRGAHILLKTDGERTTEDAKREINELKRRITDNGVKFADLAAEYSEDLGSASLGGDLDMVERGAFVPEFSDALWRLDVGELSDPVESMFGVHLITLLEVEEVEVQALDERREELIEELRFQRAQEPYHSAIDELDRLAFEIPDTLDSVAEALNLQVESIEDITRTTRDGLFANSNVLSAFFTDDVILNRYNSKPVEIDDRTTVVGRIVSSEPPRQLSYEEVKDEISDILIDEEAIQRANDMIEKALQELDNTLDFGAVESLTGKQWIKRESTKLGELTLDLDIREKAFKTPLPGVDGRAYFRLPSTLVENKEFLVVVSNVKLGDYEAMSDERRTELSDTLSQRVGNQELGGYLWSLRTEGSLKILSDALTSN